MKRKRIVTVLAILFAVAGCSVSAIEQGDPSPAVSSAGSAAVEATKKIASAAKKQAEKTANVAPKETDPKKKETANAIEDKPVQSDTGYEQSSGSSSSYNQPSPAPQAVQTPSEPVYQEPEPQPVYEEPVYQEPEPTLTPAPVPPPQACPGGKNPYLGCDVILDANYYRETFGSYNEAMARGQYYMDEVMYIGDIEITSYSVQEVYRNDHSIAYYGLNLWSSGSLIQ